MVSWAPDVEGRSPSGWRPQRCTSCGGALETWTTPIEAGSHSVCSWCGLVYVADEHGRLERVELDALPPELRTLLEEVMSIEWTDRLAVAAALRR